MNRFVYKIWNKEKEAYCKAGLGIPRTENGAKLWTSIRNAKLALAGLRKSNRDKYQIDEFCISFNRSIEVINE